MKKTVGSDLIREGAESEVGDFQIELVVEEEILGLEIPVKDASGMAVTDGGDELLEIATAEILAEPPLGDLGEELTAFGEFHDEEDLRFGGEDLQEAHDGGVAQAVHDSDLPLDVGVKASLVQPLLAHRFDRNALPRPYVPASVHFRERPTSHQLPHLVLSEQHSGASTAVLRREFPGI